MADFFEGFDPMQEHIDVEGRITQILAGTMFRVELDNGHQLLAHISGQMRQSFIRLKVDDRVQLELSPGDLNKGRITERLPQDAHSGEGI